MNKTRKRILRKKSILLSAEEQSLLEKLNNYRIKSDTEVPDEEYVFKVQGIGCMALGDLSAVKAEPKKGKTTTLKWISATALKGELGQLQSELGKPVILWADTEQKVADAKLIIEDIKKMTGLSYKFLDNHLMVFSLRKIDCKTMFDQLKAAIKAYQPDVVVIDGVAEFVNSVNDESEARELIHKLMITCEEYSCAIVCVLHENRSGSRDMKGHLGAQLTQKAGTIIECNKSGDVITVKCKDARHQSTPDWSIRFNELGNIEDADGHSFLMAKNARPSYRPNKKQLADAQKKKERIDFCLSTIQNHGGSINRKDLIDLLQNNKGIDRTTASNLLKAFINKDKVLFESNKIVTASPSEAAPS